MNFAEFPIALLTDRVPRGQKSIKFEDQIYDERRKKIITRRRDHRGLGGIRPAHGHRRRRRSSA